MATIAGPRPNLPRHIGTLIDVSSPSSHSSIKRAQTIRHWSDQRQPMSSPRVRYLAASNSQRPEFLISNEPPHHLGISQTPRRGSTFCTPVAQSFPYEALSSGSSSETSFGTTAASEVLLNALDKAMTEVQADIASFPVTPVKTLYEKALPPKPALRPQYSPERRGVLDASDMASNSLNRRFPPLEPTSSPDSISSISNSPAYDSISITESLLTNGRSPYSDSEVTEYGIAKSTSIQSIVKPRLEIDVRHSVPAKVVDTQERYIKLGATHVSQPEYVLAAPGSIQQQGLNSPSNTGHRKNGSPVKTLRHIGLRSKTTNRSSLRGGDAISRGGHCFIAVADARRNVLRASEENNASPNDESILPNADGNDRLLQADSPLDNLVSDNSTGCSQRSSKYGYNIRESLDAHEFIMGEQGKVTPKAFPVEYEGGDFSSTKGDQKYEVREVKIQLATPAAKGRAKNKSDTVNQDNAQLSTSDKNGNDIHNSVHPKNNDRIIKEEVQRDARKRGGFRVPTQKPLVVTPPHPPRTSSLPTTPASSAFNKTVSARPFKASHISERAVIGTIRTEACAPDGNGINLNLNAAESPRLSLLYRQTASSAARASLAGNKLLNSQVSSSHLPQSRTLSSLSDVSKGMKKFGKKVGKIIPSRRSTTGATTPREVYLPKADEIQIPSRQPSHLLTTYKNSGMKNASPGDLRQPVRYATRLSDTQPEDKQESTEACSGKNNWRDASETQIVDAGGVHNFLPPHVQSRLQADGGNGDEPPNRHPTRGGQSGHSVEAIEEELFNSGEEEISADSTGESNPDALPVRSSVTNTRTESNLSSSGIRNNIFDQMIVETDAQAQELMDYAVALEDSPFRELMIESATRLAEGLMRLREARIQSIRMSHAIDEMTVVMANNNLRMASLLRDST